ncbi:MAG TPA: hypothetical protein VLQ78_09840 [Ornithinibacter sp.]|nr:hypothetical protein [Ornithinibacter sp.]
MGTTTTSSDTTVTPGIREDPVGWALLSRETGEVVVWQAPNLPAVVSQVAAVVAVLAPAGSRFRSAAGATAAVASTWWGADELARGVNPLRRALGATTLVAVASFATVTLRRRG